MSVKYSPMEIQEMQFALSRKGYDMEEVRSFLMSMAEQIELLLKEREQMRRELDFAREELAGHKQREQILKDTLLTAQKVAKDIKIQAERESEVMIKEAELRADIQYREASRKAADVERQVRDLKLMKNRLIFDMEQTLERFQRFLKEETGQETSREADVSTFVRGQD
ncbi:MAG TPA: DivIVA domain-containing protein [Thermoanaerobaculia bacterium]|nr:DivIVA domain-containing protein [Thermoanaerobaculia bacterium]HXK66907.1 DivIVA domain-containing protein [Thermoanaerobaculia bacterium]